MLHCNAVSPHKASHSHAYQIITHFRGTNTLSTSFYYIFPQTFLVQPRTNIQVHHSKKPAAIAPAPLQDALGQPFSSILLQGGCIGNHVQSIGAVVCSRYIQNSDNFKHSTSKIFQDFQGSLQHHIFSRLSLQAFGHLWTHAIHSNVARVSLSSIDCAHLRPCSKKAASKYMPCKGMPSCPPFRRKNPEAC